MDQRFIVAACRNAALIGAVRHEKRCLGTRAKDFFVV